MKLDLVQSLFRKVCVVGTTSLLLSGCGENFQGTFTGEATVSAFGVSFSNGETLAGCSRAPIGKHEIQAFVQVSGGSFEILIEDLKSPGSDGSFYTQSRIFREGVALRGKLKSDTEFDYTFKAAEDRFYDVKGKITPTRDAISNLEIVYYTFEPVTAGSATCQSVEIKGGNLTIQQ